MLMGLNLVCRMQCQPSTRPTTSSSDARRECRPNSGNVERKIRQTKQDDMLSCSPDPLLYWVCESYLVRSVVWLSLSLLWRLAERQTDGSKRLRRICVLYKEGLGRYSLSLSL